MQNINLYQPQNNQNANISFPDWRHFCYLNIGCAIVFICLLIYSLLQYQLEKVESNNLNKQANILEAEFQTLKKQYPPFFFSQDVEKTIANIKTQLTSQNKILAEIENQTLFTDYLLSLSKLTPSNVWLINISIDGINDSITLKGKSISMKDLQSFLSILLADKFYINSTLNIKNIETIKTEKNENELSFEISLVKNT